MSRLAGFPQDLRHALRLLARSPGFTAAAVLALAFGIGANLAIFSLIDGLLVRPPAVSEPARLVWLTMASSQGGRAGNLSYPDFLAARTAATSFSGLLGYDKARVALAAPGFEPEQVAADVVTGDAFGVLGVRAALGRVLGPEDDRPGAPLVVVLADRLWRERFGADPAVVGRTVSLNGRPTTIVGVAAARFQGTEMDPPAALWLTVEAHAQSDRRFRDLLAEADAGWLRVIGRLRPDVTLDAARAEGAVLGARLRAATGATDPPPRIILSRLSGMVHVSNYGEVLGITGLLLAGSGLVLLVACANVANLLVARAANRSREIGIRLALGASRLRLVRQLLTESLVLSILGGVAALVLGLWTGELLRVVGQLPPEVLSVASVDGRRMIFGLGLALLTGLAFGLVPALHATRRDPLPALREELPLRSRRTRLPRLQGSLVVAQVALSMILLVGAGLFVRSVQKAAAVQVGFDARRLVAARFDLALVGYEPERRAAFERVARERIEGLPGVESVSIAGLLPLGGTMVGAGIFRRESAGERPDASVALNTVEPDYFEALGIPLLQGRIFGPESGAGPAGQGVDGVVVLNETAARRLWPGENPLGRRIGFHGAEGPWREVVGVVADSKYDDLTESPRLFAYLPRAAESDLFPDLGAVLLARTAGDPAALIEPIRRALRALDADLPIRMTTVAATVAERGGMGRSLASLLASFGVLALLLASMGLYAVVAFGVARRRREIGIRVALGAARGDVVRLFVVQGLRLALVGIGLGAVLALGLTWLLSSLLFGVAATDLVTFAMVSLLLAGVAVAASLVPARRAARLDPMIALRQD